MTQNPYDALSSVTTKAIIELGRKTTPRPLGVSILAVLHLVGGVLTFGIQFLLFANLEAMEPGLRAMGTSPAMFIMGVMFLSILTIASGVGMWMGTKWGWRLTVFYYVYSIVRNVSALFTVIEMADQLEGASRGPEYYMVKHAGRIVIHFLLLLYFFKDNVLAFFGLEMSSKIKIVGLVGTYIAITVAISMIRMISN